MNEGTARGRDLYRSRHPHPHAAPDDHDQSSVTDVTDGPRTLAHGALRYAARHGHSAGTGHLHGLDIGPGSDTTPDNL